MDPKLLSKMMDDVQAPSHERMVEMAKYQNARDAVAWAYKMAEVHGADVKGINDMTSVLIPQIEADLNRTLEVLNGRDKDKSS